jgi:proteasome lid subunit RPN8/RPN11
MKQELRLLDAPGEIIPITALKVPKAKQFAGYLKDRGPEVFVRLRHTRREPTSGGEIVVFSVQVERPQRLAYDIRLEEILAAVFDEEDKRQPAVLALRADFPAAPHINLTEQEFPRSLCLYDQPYHDVRLNWTPGRFLHRIRYWLAKTATGTLHADDQPLEPLLLGTSARLIVPSDFTLSSQNTHGLLDIYRVGNDGIGQTLIAYWRDQKNPPPVHAVAAVFSSVPHTHGVIRRQPLNLQQLHELCSGVGLNLAKQLATKIQEWQVHRPTPEILKSKLILILLLPKNRKEGSDVESVEQWAFVTARCVEEVGVRLGVIQKSGGVAGYILGEQQVNAEDLATIPIATLQVLNALSPTTAAAMNGVKECTNKILSIGMGTLGSQVFNNLIRSGFGQWTVVDSEVLLPHNTARHFLGNWAIGHSKAEAMAEFANAVLGGPRIAEAIHADYLAPGDHADKLAGAYESSEIVLDFSASVAVSRHLATTVSNARHLSVFLNPSGNSLIILAEDSTRTLRLDWLEMLHYRAVLEEPALSGTFQVPDTHVRYGNSCRDVSAQLAQDDVAIWAGVASKSIKQLSQSNAAAVRVYHSKPDCENLLVTPLITESIKLVSDDWTVQLDRWLIEKIAAMRQARLPNETGGILVGNFNTQSQVCSIVNVVPSPKDSSEWPTSYIRGCADLKRTIQGIETRTLGQIGYVGEWHSHPDGAAVRPSTDDLEAYSWLVAHMHPEGLPGIMMIFGADSDFRFVTQADE